MLYCIVKSRSRNDENNNNNDYEDEKLYCLSSPITRSATRRRGGGTTVNTVNRTVRLVWCYIIIRILSVSVGKTILRKSREPEWIAVIVIPWRLRSGRKRRGDVLT